MDFMAVLSDELDDSGLLALNLGCTEEKGVAFNEWLHPYPPADISDVKAISVYPFMLAHHMTFTSQSMHAIENPRVVQRQVGLSSHLSERCHTGKAVQAHEPCSKLPCALMVFAAQLL